MGPSRLLIWILGCKPTQLGAGGLVICAHYFPRNKQGVGVLWSLHSLKGLWFVPNKVYEPLRWYRPSRLRLSCRSSRRCLRCLSRNARMIVGWSPESSPAQLGWSLCLSLGFRSNFCFRFCFSFCYCLCFRIWVCRWTTTTEKKEKTRRGEVEVGEDQGQRLAALPHRLGTPATTPLHAPKPSRAPYVSLAFRASSSSAGLSEPWRLKQMLLSSSRARPPRFSLRSNRRRSSKMFGRLEGRAGYQLRSSPRYSRSRSQARFRKPSRLGRRSSRTEKNGGVVTGCNVSNPWISPKVLFKIPTTDWMLCPCTLGL